MSRELSMLETLLREGKISRRQFLKQAAVLGLTAAVTPALLSGTARAATPKKGGTFRLGVSLGDTTDSLDPATYTDDGDVVIRCQHPPRLPRDRDLLYVESGRLTRLGEVGGELLFGLDAAFRLGLREDGGCQQEGPDEDALLYATSDPRAGACTPCQISHPSEP